MRTMVAHVVKIRHCD